MWKDKDYRKKYYQANKAKTKLQNKEYRKTHKDIRDRKEYLKAYTLDHYLIYTYGITPEQYNEMFNNQEGCCAICGRHQNNFKRALHVDHDHITNKVRGLLCVNCNAGIGNLKDDIELLEKSITYLKGSM